jgi:WD40 repeat protein
MMTALYPNRSGTPRFALLLSLVALALLLSPLAIGTAMAQEAKPTLVAQTGHTGEVVSVAFNTDGSLMATGGEDATIKIWHVSSHRLLRTIAGAASPIMSLAFRPRSNELASAGAFDTTVKIWDVQTGSAKSLEVPQISYGCVAFSPDGRVLVHGGPGGLSLWDMGSGQRYRLSDDRADAITFSPDGKQFCMVSEDGKIELWRGQAGKTLLWLKGPPSFQVTKPRSGLYSVAIEARGRWLATAGATVDIWNTISGKHLLSLGERVVSVKRPLVFSPDGTRFIAAGKGVSSVYQPDNSVISIWNVGTWRHVADLMNHGDVINGLAFSPKAPTFTSVGVNSTIRFWSSSKPGEVKAPDLTINSVSALAFARGDQILAVGTGKDVILWDVDQGRPRLTLQGHKAQVRAIAVSPDGQTIASGGDQTVKLWDATTGNLLDSFDEAPRAVHCLAFSPDGETLAVGGEQPTTASEKREGWIALHRLHDKGSPLRFAAHRGAVETLTFSADSETLVSGSVFVTVEGKIPANESTVRFWRVTEPGAIL